MKRLALWVIAVYQRYISPHKGFDCAYRSYTGGAGCSNFGYRAISRFGVFGGIAILRKRLYLCGVVHRKLSGQRSGRLQYQRGDCDIGACDLPCDLFSNCGSCDWGSGRKDEKKAQKLQQAHMPSDTGTNG